MKEINIAKVLVHKRKEKGVTQDELANYVGVSKASVSKWETEQSYPDVTFLPMLASYFNISIDELMDYKPQMTKEDIRKLYLKLAADFAAKPFESVMEDCRRIIKKYYSCFPLLLQMGILMINHAGLLEEPEKAGTLIQEARSLFIRVKEESDDMQLTKKALYMEALCTLGAGDPNETLELLEGSVEAALPPELLLASAYQMVGRVKDAKSVLQAGMYQDIVVLFNYFPAYLMLCVDNPPKFDEVLKRAFSVAEAFDMSNLHPAVLSGLYICASQGYVAQNDHDRALNMLQKYAELATGGIYPLSLHGDSFFDLLDDWLQELELGNALPRDDKTIRKSMADVIVNNPAYAVLADEPRFKSIIEKLQSSI